MRLYGGMDKKLTEQTCPAFAELLASKAAVPGGGGAAALAGALGIALCNMAGKLSASPKRAGLYELNEKAEALKDELIALIDEDAENFEPLSKAYSMPKTTPGYAETMRLLTLQACKAPMKIMRCCCKAVELLEQTRALCSKFLLSDIACGASLCASALESASLNVFVNTKMLSDEDAKPIDDEADAMLAQYLPRARKITDEIMNTLRGRC